jgi:hypothetical protein
MSTFVNKIILVLSLTFLSSFVNASLITNGSFEQTVFNDNSTSIGAVFNKNLQTYNNNNNVWDVFYQLPGWVTTMGNGIELQKNIVTQSQDGSNHVELDSHINGISNTVMTQTIESLTVGNQYLLEFYYKPRTINVNDNGINVFWYDSAIDFNLNLEAIFVADSTSLLTKDWALQSVTFTAKAQSMNLSFGSIGTQNTLGGLIDNVSLKEVAVARATSVPEPSMLLLFLTAIVFLIIGKQKLASSTRS